MLFAFDNEIIVKRFFDLVSSLHFRFWDPRPGQTRAGEREEREKGKERGRERRERERGRWSDIDLHIYMCVCMYVVWGGRQEQ